MNDYSIAVLEDETSAADILCEYVKNYGQSNDITFKVDVYPDPLEFFKNKKPFYDIVFMDIEMPKMNGLAAAKKLREFDEHTVLIFVTNLGQYAIKGYEVQALDFIVKPLKYGNFVIRMQRAISYLKSKTEHFIILPLPYGTVRIALSEIYFIEIRVHTLFFNTKRGIIETRGALSDYEEMLNEYGFFRCSKCSIINTKYIESFSEGIIHINNESIVVSRKKLKDVSDLLKTKTGEPYLSSCK